MANAKPCREPVHNVSRTNQDRPVKSLSRDPTFFLDGDNQDGQSRTGRAAAGVFYVCLHADLRHYTRNTYVFPRLGTRGIPSTVY